MGEKFSKKRNQQKDHKQRALRKITWEIEQCDECKKETVGKIVPGEGNPDAQIVFVGEAPGKKEAASGKPFIGRSGKLLRKTMEGIGLKAENVFITSVGKYLPLKGKPSASQIAHSRPYLLQQIAIIQPSLIVLLGATAVQGLLQQKISIIRDHGMLIRKNGIMYFVTLHPAAALRFPNLRAAFFEDFQKLKKLISNE